MNSPDPAPRSLLADALQAQTAPRWQVRLLGAVEASDGSQRLQRFPSRAVAALLARVACAPERAHPREELIELLWPGVALDVGRNRLRQALSTLKSLLEPPGVPGAVVLQADRLAVRAAPGALISDALGFEALARRGDTHAALAQYGGEFMPGYYDEWVLDERTRLADLHERLLARPLPAAPARALPAERTAPALPAVLPGPSLPSYLTRSFGAEATAAVLQQQVLAQRLVTLLGPGGSGKTRLAVDVARACAAAALARDETAAFQRVGFVPLVACAEIAAARDAMAAALNLSAGAAQTAETLAAALAGQRLLLVLDNFEQLIGQAEGLLARLLEQLPGLHLLVTSRHALGLDGETLVDAQPLPVPAAEASLAEAATNPAVALFVDRARAARSDFHLGAGNGQAVVALVRALSGMPLAIELAASRVRSVAPTAMLALLGDGGHLALLARGGPRGGHDPRHASMEQVIAWSWQLLDAPAQRLLGAMSLFPAQATLPALAAVTAQAPAQTAARLDDLQQHCLLYRADGDAARFGLLEAVREFAAAKLQPEDALAMRHRLRRWLLAWVRSLPSRTRLAEVATELATVHAALAGAAADGCEAASQAIELALALRDYWDTDALPGRIQTALEQALKDVSDPALLADAHELLAYLRFEAGFGAAAMTHADAALHAAGQHPQRRARALVRAAWVRLAAARDARDDGDGPRLWSAWLAEALALARASGDRDLQARALHQQAVLATQVHADWAGGEAMLAQSQALWLALGDRRKAHARWRNRAQCWLWLGRQDEALACYLECERAALEDGDWVGRIDTLISLGSLLSLQRQWQEALDAHRRCVALCWQRWHRHGLAYALWNPPRLLARLRRPEPAMRLMGFAVRFWTENFGPLSRADLAYVRRVRKLVVLQLGQARAQALEMDGAGMDVAAAAQLALQA